MKRFLVVVVVAACSSDDPSVTLCTDDGDCGVGTVCEQRDNQPVCVAVTEAPIIIGHSAATSGTNQQLGTALKVGIDMAFAEQNALGGIRGRVLELVSRDDAYDPPLAESTARDLVDAQPQMGVAPKCPSSSLTFGSTSGVTDVALSRGPGAVLAILGSAGNPTSQRAAAVAIETGTVYFAPVTGSTLLFRDDAAGACSKYIFNVRASYAQEARATLELFMAKGVAAYTNLISFDQNDSFGDAGYNGLVAAYTDFVGPFPTGADPTTPIKRFRYVRNDDTSVPAQAVALETYLAELLTNQAGTVTVGVMMTNTYGAANTLITHVRNWQYDGQQAGLQKATRLKLYFSNVSFVGPDALADRMIASGTVSTPSGPKSYSEDVFVSQVVPNYAGDASSLVSAYNRGIEGKDPTFMSLEGYLNAKVLLAALLAHQGPFTPDALATTIENQAELPVGLDGSYGFSPTNHQYSSSVWGTALQPNGSYANLYSWRAGAPIQIAP